MREPVDAGRTGRRRGVDAEGGRAVRRRAPAGGLPQLAVVEEPAPVAGLSRPSRRAPRRRWRAAITSRAFACGVPRLPAGGARGDAGHRRVYEPVARLFLGERSEPIAEDLARLSGREIHAFVLREARQRRQRAAETMVCALRSLLRFLHVQGWIAMPLAEAVPSVRKQREGLPRGLAADQVSMLFASCDRDTAAGRRDFAILMLLTRLGLRRGEVAALKLDDVDWRAGEIVIRGKGSRHDVLPLPVDVGEALVDYLRHGRPRGFGRRLVLPARAPYSEMSPGGVSQVVVRACKRAGIERVGAHRLRHTIATELLRRGAGLPEIGQLLRHQSIDTTAIYAKVDRRALSRLALAWPGSES